MQFLSAKSPPIDLRRERYDIGDEQIRRKSSEKPWMDQFYSSNFCLSFESRQAI